MKNQFSLWNFFKWSNKKEEMWKHIIEKEEGKFWIKIVMDAKQKNTYKQRKIGSENPVALFASFRQFRSKFVRAFFLVAYGTVRMKNSVDPFKEFPETN